MEKSKKRRRRKRVQAAEVKYNQLRCDQSTDFIRRRKRKTWATNSSSPFSTSSSSSSCLVQISQPISHCWTQNPSNSVCTISDPTQTGTLFPPLDSSRKWTLTECSLIGHRAVRMSNDWLICLGSRRWFAELVGPVSNRLRGVVGSLWLAEMGHCVLNEVTCF